MKKQILALSVSTLFLISCLDRLASTILYQNDEANKTQVSEVAPVPLERMDVTNSDKSKTNVWYYRHPSERVPVLIFFHGNASNIQGIYNSGFTEKLRVMNIHFVIFDYPKYGLSTGTLNQKGVLQSGQNAIDLARKLFPRSKMILWGRSLGAAPATLLTEKNQSFINGLILTSPWDSFWKLAKAKSGLPDSAAQNAAKGNEYESEVAARNITRPVLIHHGDKDETIPYELGVNLYNSFASTDKNLITVVGGGHNNLLSDKEWGEIEEFIFSVSR